MALKTKILSLFKTNTTENYSKSTRANNMYGGRKKRTKSEIKKNNQERNKLKAIEGKIIRDIKKLFEQEEYDYYK